MRFYHLLIAIAAFIFTMNSLNAKIVTKEIDYKAGDVSMRGYLAYDDSITTKMPGVLIVPEWWGLNDYAKRRARDVAALGYVAFGADMYGDGKTTTDPKQAGAWSGEVKGSELIRTRSRAALDVLAKQHNVDASRLASIGYCFGGSTSLELAYSGAPVLGIVSFHGGLTAPKTDDATPIPAKLLILHGAADTFQKEPEVAKVRDELERNGADWQMVYYSGAVHAFTNPDAGKFGIPGIAYNKAADERSWRAMCDFLQELFQ